MKHTIFLFTHRFHSRSYAKLGLVLFATAFPSFGCSSGDAEEALLTEDSFLEAYVAETCSRASTCCTLSKVGYNQDFCRNRARAAILKHKTDLEDRGLPWNFHLEHARRCLNEMKSRPTDCSEFFNSNACWDAYKGDVGIGESCLQPWDCRAVDTPYEEGYTACAYYRTYGGEAKLFCQLTSKVREVGEACNIAVGASLPESVIETCSEDGFCYRGTCIELSESGGPCPCAEGFWCGGGDNTCAPLGGLGAPCKSGEACVSGVCGDDGTCHPIGKSLSYYCVNPRPWED